MAQHRHNLKTQENLLVVEADKVLKPDLSFYQITSNMKRGSFNNLKIQILMTYLKCAINLPMHRS